MTYTVRAIRTEPYPDSAWTVPEGEVLVRTDILADALGDALGFMADCDPNEAAEIVNEEGDTYRPNHGDTVDDVAFEAEDA